MSEDVIRAVGAKILNSGQASKKLSILWHAGEPLVLSPSYYKTAFEILKDSCPAEITIKHCMQSNATLLSDEWCNLIQEYDIEFGISIDGPQTLHDLHRTSRTGRGTFSKAKAGLDLLNDRKIPFHVICVLSRQSLCQPEVLFRFFEGHHISRVHFNIEEIEGANPKSSLEFESVSLQFHRFFETYWNLIAKTQSKQFIREIHNTVRLLLNSDEEAAPFNELTTPFSCVTITARGDISTFSPELIASSNSKYGDFRFGNILHDCLFDIKNSLAFKIVHDEIRRGVEKCRADCEYFSVCGGGSPSNKLSENEDLASTETLYCKLRVQTLVDLALSRLFGECNATV
jgi:uncharacterized protein